MISDSTFCMVFWHKVLVPESQQIELSRKHCHELMLVSNTERGLNSGIYHDNPIKGTKVYTSSIGYSFSNNKWFKKFSNKSGRAILKVFPPDMHRNLNSAVCRKD